MSLTAEGDLRVIADSICQDYGVEPCYFNIFAFMDDGRELIENENDEDSWSPMVDGRSSGSFDNERHREPYDVPEYPPELIRHMAAALKMLEEYVTIAEEDLPRVRHYFYDGLLQMRQLYQEKFQAEMDYDGFWFGSTEILTKMGEKIPQFNAAWEDNDFVRKFYTKACVIAEL